MSDQPTPETDALLYYLKQQFPATEGHIPLRERISKLERERDEAREKLDVMKDALCRADVIAADRLEERDQLRKVVDKLAEHVEGTVEIQCGYNSLPHVIAAKKGNEV